MTPTTLRTLRPAWITAIQGLVPNDSARRNARWRPVNRVGDVPNGDPSQLRRFYLQLPIDEVTNPGDGIYGCAVEREIPLRVWTNYCGISENEEEVSLLIEEDGWDLWYLLDGLRDPNTNGFLGPAASNTPLWIFEGEEPGGVWGYHEILVRWLARNS